MQNKKILNKLLKVKEENLLFPFNFAVINKYFKDKRDYKVEKNNIIISHCGSSGCLLGNLPQFDKNWKFDILGHLVYKNECMNIPVYFELDQDIVEFLFFPCTTYNDVESPDENATLEEVQNHIKITMLEYPEKFI